jgi:hypothetical protein
MNKIRFVWIAASLISLVLIFVLIRGNSARGANMEKEDPKVIFERIVTSLAKDAEMLKEIKCHEEDTFDYGKNHFQTCFAYKWFAPAFQTYAEKVLEGDIANLESSNNDYGTPSVVYILSKNPGFYLQFIYRSVERSYFLGKFDDLKGYKGQIMVIVGEN